MTLPKLIEIVPVQGPFKAAVSIPGSKSMTNRALIIGAQGKGLTKINGALWSDDTQVMVDCLQKLGFDVEVSPDPNNACNRHIEIWGSEGLIPEKEADLYVGNAGTTARFITAFCALGEGEYRIFGDERMHERPMAELFKILAAWGIGFTFEGKPDHLPVRMHVPKQCRVPSKIEVDVSKSSQFASALELIRPRLGYEIQINGFDDDHYFNLTKAMVKKAGPEIVVEPDASSATYFWAAESLIGSSRIAIKNWSKASEQIDSKFVEIARYQPSKVSRKSDLGDSVMMAAVMGSFWPNGVLIDEAGRLREQETDRLAALETELKKCGAEVKATENSLQIQRETQLHGAEIETYNDHRMAMAFSILGLKVPGMRIRNPECVSKTFPNFFETLDDAARQSGLGPVILDAVTQKPLFR